MCRRGAGVFVQYFGELVDECGNGSDRRVGDLWFLTTWLGVLDFCWGEGEWHYLLSDIFS